MVADFTCDNKCPAGPVGQCCHYCNKARPGYVSESNKHMWSDEKGFLGSSGCNLPREEMPVECREYTCKNLLWSVCDIRYALMAWEDNEWKQSRPVEGRFIWLSGELDSAVESISEVIRKYNTENNK